MPTAHYLDTDESVSPQGPSPTLREYPKDGAPMLHVGDLPTGNLLAKTQYKLRLDSRGIRPADHTTGRRLSHPRKHGSGTQAADMDRREMPQVPTASLWR